MFIAADVITGGGTATLLHGTTVTLLPCLLDTITTIGARCYKKGREEGGEEGGGEGGRGEEGGGEERWWNSKLCEISGCLMTHRTGVGGCNQRYPYNSEGISLVTNR